MVYVNTKNGNHTIDFFAVIYKDKHGNDITDICIDNYKIHTLRVYYRHPKTWDDYMGNTPCGYYCNVPIAGKKHRIYYEKMRSIIFNQTITDKTNGGRKDVTKLQSTNE